MTGLTKKERLIRQTLGQEIDQIPTIGGWILGVTNLSKIADITVETFLENPSKGTIKAYQNLDVDGMIQPVVPTSIDQIRTGSVQEEHFRGIEPEAILHRANQLPDSELEILNKFDYQTEENRYRSYFDNAYSNWEGIEPIPNFWEIGGHFPLYTEYGYNAFLMACALYPEAVGKIYWVKSIKSREKAKILARIFKEYELVPLMFCGEDVCNNKGPMVSPVFLRNYYFPTVQMIIEPLVDAGIRLIHHCDGDVRPILHDLLEIGFSGFQGFQYELGINIHDLKNMTSPYGKEILIFAGLSVSKTLPFGSIQDIRNEVDYFFEATNGGHGLFLITSNVAGVEVPAENIVEAYRYIKSLDTISSLPARKWERWPGIK